LAAVVDEGTEGEDDDVMVEKKEEDEAVLPATEEETDRGIQDERSFPLTNALLLLPLFVAAIADTALLFVFSLELSFFLLLSVLFTSWEEEGKVKEDPLRLKWRGWRSSSFRTNSSGLSIVVVVVVVVVMGRVVKDGVSGILKTIIS
jgi:hypothetical protein